MTDDDEQTPKVSHRVTRENVPESFPQALIDIGITPQMIHDCWEGYANGLDIWGRE